MNIRTLLAALLVGLSAVGAVAGPAEAARPVVTAEPTIPTCDTQDAGWTTTTFGVRKLRYELVNPPRLHAEISTRGRLDSTLVNPGRLDSVIVNPSRPLPRVLATLIVATDHTDTVCGRVAVKAGKLAKKHRFEVTLVHKTGNTVEKFGIENRNLGWMPTEIDADSCTRTQARVAVTNRKTGTVTRYTSAWAITGLCPIR